MPNGGVQASTSPSVLPSCSPVESSLAVGSFLERRAWHLFRAAPRSGGEGPEMPEEGEQPGTPPLAQEVEESLLLGKSPCPVLQRGATAPPAEPTGLRRRELTIMDYDQTVGPPEF